MSKNGFIFTFLQIYARGKKYDLRKGGVEKYDLRKGGVENMISEREGCKKYDFQCNIYCRPLSRLQQLDIFCFIQPQK